MTSKREQLKACPTCSGPRRETVGMVCQTCGTDYGVSEPDAYRDGAGIVWLNRRKHPIIAGVFDAEPSCTPLWFSAEPPTDSDPHGSDAARPIG